MLAALIAESVDEVFATINQQLREPIEALAQTMIEANRETMEQLREGMAQVLWDLNVGTSPAESEHNG